MLVTKEQVDLMSVNLKAFRVIFQLRAADLAEMLGISRQAVQLWESQKYPMTVSTYLAMRYVFDKLAETVEPNKKELYEYGLSNPLKLIITKTGKREWLRNAVVEKL